MMCAAGGADLRIDSINKVYRRMPVVRASAFGLRREAPFLVRERWVKISTTEKGHPAAKGNHASLDLVSGWDVQWKRSTAPS
jgi:hypothetical protein